MNDLPEYVAFFGSYSGQLPKPRDEHERVIDAGPIRGDPDWTVCVFLKRAEYFKPVPVRVIHPDGTESEEELVDWTELFCEQEESFAWSLGEPRLRIRFTCVDGNDISSITGRVMLALGPVLAEMLNREAGEHENG